ncbi:HEPN domain-containing protein [Methylocystis rosea]|uniref:Uncharacterized protein n=1 Tax=Methylocystis rosea TaxID=173366 RepID=A0A3G8M3K1_9HYPH|nr:HEPN domain-containing protein [Methylocystis rosea]AZG76287.1 hypothetical protein EHO51_05845 [Methylocystis rosea]
METRSANFRFVAAIWGLSIEEEVEIAPGLMLLPFDHLPDSEVKRWLVGRAIPWPLHAWYSTGFFGRPGAALVRTVTNFPYVGNLEEAMRCIEKLEEDLRAPLYFLQAAVAGQPLAVGAWFEYEDPDLELGERVGSFSWFLPEVVPSITQLVTVDTVSLKREADLLRDLVPDVRSKLLRSMERFVLSQCRRNAGDRALDLVLAFETAVSGGKGDNSPVNWRIAVRTAQMLGGTLEQRKETRRVVSQLGGFRNGIVHGGALKAHEQKELEENLLRSSLIYRQLLRSFLSLGTAPDWSALELQPTSDKDLSL